MFNWTKWKVQPPPLTDVTVAATVTCPYCEGAAELVTGADVYPHRHDLRSHNFWRCAPCDAFVGCHKPGSFHHDDRTGQRIEHTGIEPLGRLANAELRRAKQRAHAAFDPLWQSREMSRTKAYAWLAGAMGIPLHECHIGYFDVEQCERVVALISDRVFGGAV